MTSPLTAQQLDDIEARHKAASKGPWTLAYACCDCSEDCGHGMYVSRINTGSGPATELCDLPRADWELMVHARQDGDVLLAEVRRLTARVAELERPAVEAKRNEIRQSFTELAAQAEQDRDHEGAASLECQLREREEQWKAEDAETKSAPARTLTEGEYNSAWHAVEGAAGEEGADPGTILHAVLDRLGIALPADETHVVADDSDDPEHIDDCPGCEPARRVQCNDCGAVGEVFTGDDGLAYLDPSGQIGHHTPTPV